MHMQSNNDEKKIDFLTHLLPLRQISIGCRENLPVKQVLLELDTWAAVSPSLYPIPHSSVFFNFLLSAFSHISASVMLTCISFKIFDVWIRKGSVTVGIIFLEPHPKI